VPSQLYSNSVLKLHYRLSSENILDGGVVLQKLDRCNLKVGIFLINGESMNGTDIEGSSSIGR
jgi:hypothetical protein